MMKSSTLRCSFGSIQSFGIEGAVAAVAARHLAGDLAGEIGDIEILDAARAASAPAVSRSHVDLDAAAERRDETQDL